MESKNGLSLEKKGNVYYLKMDSGKANNINPEFISAFHEALDVVEKDEKACALVTISEKPKFYSTGLDLNYLFTKIPRNKNDFILFLTNVNRLFGRILVLNCPTIAIIEGISMAGGFLLAMAHDFRYTVDKGVFFQLNEVDLGGRLPPGMNAVANTKVNSHFYNTVLMTGKKLGVEDALKNKVVDGIFAKDQIREKVHEIAEEYSKKNQFKESYHLLKVQMYDVAYTQCFQNNYQPHETKYLDVLLDMAPKL